MRRTHEVVVLNPDHKDHSMRHRRFPNPDSLKGVAVDSGMALAAGAGAAVVLGLGAVAVNKIEYGTPAAPTPPQTAAMYRLGLLSVLGLAVGAGMQYGGEKVAGAGKALLVLSIGVPVAAIVSGKVSDAMLPETAVAADHTAANGALGAMLAMAVLPAPETATSRGMNSMGDMGGWSPARALGAPSGALPDYSNQFRTPAFNAAMGR